MIPALTIYLLIGAAFLIALDCCGRIENVCEAWRAQGRAPSLVVVTTAAVMVIGGWPRFVWLWARGRLS